MVTAPAPTARMVWVSSIMKVLYSPSCPGRAKPVFSRFSTVFFCRYK